MTRLAPLHPSRRLSGSRSELLADPASFYGRIAHQHGGIARFRIFHRTVHAVADPAMVHQILVSRKEIWGKHFDLYRNAEQMIGRGLVSLNDGPEWRNDRRIIQPALHRSALAGVVSTVNRAFEEGVAGWEMESYTDFVPRIRTITLRIISESLLGTTLEAAQTARLSEKLMVAARLLTLKNWSPLALPEPWPTPLNIRLRRSRQEMQSFLSEQVNRRIDEGVGSRGDLLDLLLLAEQSPEPPGIERSGVIGEMLTVFSAGYDTTSSALAWSVYFLAAHPDIQTAVRAEVDRVIGDGAVDWDHLPRLEQVELVFNGAMRIRPPVHTIARVNRVDDQIGGYHIPAHSRVMVSIFGVHRAPGSWTDPESFRPDRFLGDYDSRAFLPFASGPRRCVGALFATMESKIILARLLQRFRFELKPGTKVQTSASAALYPENLQLAFTPRTTPMPTPTP